MSEVTPRDREEKLLAAIAEGTTGNLPTPRNRKEKLLKEIYDNGSSGGGGTTNYNDLTNKPSINNVPLVGNLNTANLKLTDPTLTKEGVPAEAKAVGTKLNKLEGKYAKKDLYDDTTINVGRKADTRIGSNSTAEGYDTTSSGYCSHAEGYDTTADGDCSHAEGQGTNANYESQHVQGKYNIEDTENKYAHIVGNGTSKRKRSNAHTLDWEGNAWYAGDVCNGNGVSLDNLLSITTNNLDFVENFSGNENVDNAPMGIRKGQSIIGHPSRFEEWVMYQTYYYDAGHQYGWQLAFNMNGNGIAYRYKRNSTWNDWAYLVLES